MVVCVSECLLGVNCKYSGGNNKNRHLLDLLEGHEVVGICPEVLGGLPTPRVPSEIQRQADGTTIVINKEGTVVDEQFRKGAEEALRIALDAKADLCILQARSPSCGVKEIYDGTFSGTRIPGTGVCAGLMIRAGLKVFDSSQLEDITDLNQLV